MTKDFNSATHIELLPIEMRLRIGGSSEQRGVIRAWTWLGQKGWRGIALALLTGAIATGVVLLLVFVAGSMTLGMMCAVLFLPIWLFVNYRIEYECSFGTGVLRRFTLVGGIRLTCRTVAGPSATYMLGSPAVCNSETGVWTFLGEPALALVAVEIGDGGALTRKVVLYGVTRRQVVKLRQLARTLNLRNRIAQEQHDIGVSLETDELVIRSNG